MLVNLLALIIVVRMQLTVRTGDGLRRFVGLEPLVQHTFGSRQRRFAEALIRQHQVVMGLQILGVDFEHPLELGDRLAELALQEERPAKLVADNSISRVLRRRCPEMLERVIVSPEALEGETEKKMARWPAAGSRRGLCAESPRQRSCCLPGRVRDPR